MRIVPFAASAIVGATLFAARPAIAQDQPVAADTAVPANLTPLLAPRHSEIQLVSTRYILDRNQLIGNYAGAPVRGRGRGRVDSAAPQSLPLCSARLSRLKRFDLSWLTALGRVDSGSLSEAGRRDLAALRDTVARDLNTIETDAATLHRFAPAFPFAPDLVTLVEARIQLHDVDPEDAARTLDQAVGRVRAVRATFDSGATARPDDARRLAATVEMLRNNLGTWFGFYDGYDPLFTWWVPVSYHALDQALGNYSAFLRDTLAARADSVSAFPHSGASTLVAVVPSPPPAYAGVPDLTAIIALPQDEMAPVVQRFLGRDRNRGYAGGGANNARTPHDSAYYQRWLDALRTLDFDHLTRNAQVDYLYLRYTAQLQLARLGHPLPEHPPRKTDNSGLPGDARGREGLIRDLQDEMIPYTPEQLIVLANREFAWCEAQMRAASRQMGYGDDWKAALERTKTMHVPPGGQPAAIRGLLDSAIAFVRRDDLVTVPEIDAETLHMTMLTPREQLVNPFFLGGSLIQVAYPTDSMSFDAREQSMRGNNLPWSHATAFHEMIPGHNLSGYTNARYNGYRADLGISTPFYVEGWAVYWELLLYDKGYDVTPEERVGALFWRMFRCARIIFSLNFHMGNWSPEQAVDFLVDRVGHERDNATAEVRRSFQGNYGPLYQAGYLLGALQLRALRHELVDSHQMTEKAFHDAVLRQGEMPIALLRLAIGKEPLTRDMDITWKFYGDLPDSAATPAAGN